MIRIDDALLRVKRIRQSRNGAFCVADLSTDIGEFKVKDPLLDQFEEGEYQATVWISEIFLAQYVAFGKGVTEIRARLHDLQVQAQGSLPAAHEQIEPDPLDEQAPTRVTPAQASAAPSEATRPQTSDFSRFNKRKKAQASGVEGNMQTPAPVEPADELHALFDTELVQAIQNREPVKLDSTVERTLLRRQAAELGQRFGYRFDAKQQTWFSR